MADTLDILTLDEAKAVISKGSMDTADDDLLAAVVTTASRTLDEYIGPVVKRSVTSETITANGFQIELAFGPVSAVSTVTEAGVALTSADWYAEPYRPDPTLFSGIIVRRSGGFPIPWQLGLVTGRQFGLGFVQVGYIAGRVASTTQVDPRHKQGCALILKNLWRTYENAVGTVDEYAVPHNSFPTFAVPQAVRGLLQREWRSSVGFGA